jgi:hypothetical protein
MSGNAKNSADTGAVGKGREPISIVAEPSEIMLIILVACRKNCDIQCGKYHKDTTVDSLKDPACVQCR